MQSSNLDLTTPGGLAAACKSVMEWNRGKPAFETWKTKLATFLHRVHNADLQERLDRGFLHEVWDGDQVSAVGQGNVQMDRALNELHVRRWFAEMTIKDLPPEGEARTAALAVKFEETLAEVARYCDRTPRLKAFRAFAVFFPKDFTTIAHVSKVRRLHRAMDLGKPASAVHAHRQVLDRVAEVMGPVGESLEQIAERMILPWLLFVHGVSEKEEEITERPGDVAGDAKLVPLPAARRRRGLTAIGGGVATMLGVLDFASGGVTDDELVDYIRSTNPKLKETSINAMIYGLSGEFAVIRREGKSYRLTDRGTALLESEDPDELSDWLLTHILGVDHVLVWLRDRGDLAARQLVSELQTVNPSWTTLTMPHSMVGWLKQFGVIEVKDKTKIGLTDRGREWARRIDWAPAKLDPMIEPPHAAEVPARPQAGDDEGAQLPSFDEIYRAISAEGVFDRKQVAALHHGLWSHPRRHFAVLSGLSGSGKTLLATAYGKALAAEQKHSDRRVLCVPVQPGWHDPSALLGYVNPLRSTSYSRTAFLEFIMRAGLDPRNAYTAILDEMNLSRPEQYLAPLLSSMETGSPLLLHLEDGEPEGVPAQLAYPDNLVLIGTVNMDESTHGLSDKVLDRAVTLEFWNMDLGRYPRWGQSGLPAADEGRMREVLTKLMAVLSPARLHFGWRVVDDIVSFVRRAAVETRSHTFEEALDHIVHAKILPKLRGEDSQRLRLAFSQCAEALSAASLENSAAKVRELEHDLHSTGTARFWR